MSDDESPKGNAEAEMQSMTGAIIQMIERFRSLQAPIVETHQAVPKATKQLDKISEQTLAAANRVLDTVEHITQKQQAIIDGLTQLKAGLPAEIHVSQARIDTLIEQSNAIINETYSIITALQFQDIITQQINYAAAMLEEFQQKLEKMTMVMQEADNEFMSAKKQRTYDPHADLFKKTTDQAEVDSIFRDKQ